jgi:hypothetical protein
MKIVAIAIIVCLALLWFAFNRKPPMIRASPPAPGVIPGSSIFHKPLGADCPAGTTLILGYFTERDGTKVDACHNPDGDGSVDYLNPGEGCTMSIRFAPESTEPKP